MGETLHLALNWLHAGSAQRDKSVQGISASGAQGTWGFHCGEDPWLLRDEAALAAFMGLSVRVMCSAGGEGSKRRWGLQVEVTSSIIQIVTSSACEGVTFSSNLSWAQKWAALILQARLIWHFCDLFEFSAGTCTWRIKHPPAEAGRGNKQAGQRCTGFAPLHLPAGHWPKPKSLWVFLELIFRTKISPCRARPWDWPHSQWPKKGAGECGQTSAWSQAPETKHRQGASRFRQHKGYLVGVIACACLLVQLFQSSLWKWPKRRCSLTKPTSEKHWAHWAPALTLSFISDSIAHSSMSLADILQINTTVAGTELDHVGHALHGQPGYPCYEIDSFIWQKISKPTANPKPISPIFTTGPTLNLKYFRRHREVTLFPFGS